MEELRLSETELRYFGDLFLCCDEKTGRIATLKATELFRSANLSNDVVKQIMSLVGIPQTSLYLSRKQFYSCLKLIAAHQAAIQLRQETITSPAQLPLPRFSWKDSPPPSTSSVICSDIPNDEVDVGNMTPENIVTQNNTEISDTVNSDQPSTDSEVDQNGGGLLQRRLRGSPGNWSTASDSPTPTNSAAERPWAKDAMWEGLLCEEQRQLLGTEEESSDRHSSDEDNDIDLESVYQIMPEQKEYYTKQFRAVQPDLNGLLAGHVARVFFEKSRIPIEELRHIWQLCDVTRDNALSLGEFTAAMHLIVLRRNNIPLPSILPPCLEIAVASAGAIIGSSGPTQILEKIDPPEADLLNLGEDTNLAEAMNQAKISPPSTTISSSGSGSSTTTLIQNTLEGHHSPTQSQHTDKDWTTSNKQWTKFPESPTSSNISSPGPKPVNFDMQRTAQAVVSDPQILHPVPLRVTPVGGAPIASSSSSSSGAASTGISNSMTTSLTGPESMDDEIVARNFNRTKTQQIANNSENLVFNDIGAGITTVISRDLADSPKHFNVMTSVAHQHRELLQNDIRPIQRPQPKKLPHKNIGALPPPPQRETTANIALASNEVIVVGTDNSTLHNSINAMAIKKDPPPLPPPRPHRHARSSSLDLNKLKLNAPPEIPPRVSPQISVDVQMELENQSFADFSQFPPDIEFQGSTESGIQDNSSPIQNQQQARPAIPSQRTSAFEVYRKPGSRNDHSPTCGSTSVTSSRVSEYEKRVTTITDNLKHVTFKHDRNLVDILKHLKDQNSLLLKLCSDLSEELLIIQQKKEEISARLDYNSGCGGDTVV